MLPVYRLLITILLAVSLPMQGVAATWQNCCASMPLAPTQATAGADHAPQALHSHSGHHHEETLDVEQQDATQALAHPETTHAHTCAHSVSCCSVALVPPPLAPVLPAALEANWLSFQAPAPDSHTPPTLDPPPRRARS